MCTLLLKNFIKIIETSSVKNKGNFVLVVIDKIKFIINFCVNCTKHLCFLSNCIKIILPSGYGGMADA